MVNTSAKGADIFVESKTSGLVYKLTFPTTYSLLPNSSHATCSYERLDKVPENYTTLFC